MKVTPAHVFLESNYSLQVVLTKGLESSLSLSHCHRAHHTSPWHLLHNYTGCQKDFGKSKKHLRGRELKERSSIWRKKTDERGSWEPIKYCSVELMSYEIQQPGNTEVSLPILASFANVWKSHFFTTLGFSFCITVPTDLGRLLHFFPSFFVHVNIRVHVGHWRNLEFQSVTAVTYNYSAVSENSRALCGRSGLTHFSERIPGRLVKPTGLISQNNVCVCVCVGACVTASCQISLTNTPAAQQGSASCISGLSLWLSSLLISLCFVDLHSLESPDYFDPRATQSTILGVWVESCPWDCHRDMPLGWQGGSLSCLICQLHPSLLFGDPHQEIIQMKWCK